MTDSCCGLTDFCKAIILQLKNNFKNTMRYHYTPMSVLKTFSCTL